MPQGKVEEYGKFLYIEPNNLNGEGVDNAIPHDYEDYSMAINLEVRIPRRDACGSEDGLQIMYFSSDNGTISFLGGSGGDSDKQGYLTTNYTDVSPIGVGEGNKESLGIKNIEISYDSWFFPMVVIDFVDVRGASLMMPQEESFFTTTLRGDRDSTQMNGGSFFKALFSFPQPLFKLTVKGFYGRPAIYNLAVLDFKSNFNAQSGNFECKVQFKGYMYGVYADIPMTFLSVAPYIGAGEKKYNEFWKDFNYIDENGQIATPMLTYPELKRVISSGITNMNKMISETDAGRDFSNVQKKKKCIEEIQNIFNNIFNSFLLGKTEENKTNVTYFYLAKQEKDARKFSDESNKNLNSFTYILDRIKGYDKAAFSENDAKQLQSLVKKELDGGLKYVCTLIKDKNTRSWTIENGNFVTSDKKQVVTIDTLYELIPDIIENNNIIKKGLKSSLAGSPDTKLMLYGITFKQDVNNYFSKLIKRYKEDEDRTQINLNREKLNQLRNILGFLPSIQNMFNMAFAHMETFVNSYYKMLDNIKSDITAKNRPPSKFGITGNNDSDLSTNTVQTPPFPLFIKERIENGVHINKVVPPWEVRKENAVDMWEVKFVDELISGAKLFTDKLDEVNKIIDGATNAPLYPSPTLENVVPVTLYDFNHIDSFNPYKSINEVNGNSEDKALQAILTFFLRAYYFFLIFDDLNGEDTERYFGRLEAINFKKAVPEMTTELRRSLLKKFNNSNGGANAFSCLLKGKNGAKSFWDIFTSPSPVTSSTFFSKDDRDAGFRFTYEWLKSEDDNGNIYHILPVGEFNVTKIKNDITSGEFINSDKYITIKNGEPKDIKESGKTSNSNSFRVYCNDGDYFSTMFQLIKNSDDEIPDVRESMIKQVEKQTENIIGTKPYYMRKFTVKKINKKGEEVDKHKNSGIFTNEGNLFYEYSNDSYRYFDLKEAIINGKKSDSIYGVVGDSTAIDGDMDDSLFTGTLKDVYNAQETNEAKAYLYLMSLPLDPNMFATNDSQYGYSNGSTLLTMLLREGAFWWRNNSESEPLIIDSKYKAIDSNLSERMHIPIKLVWDTVTGKIVKSTLSILPANSQTNYIAWPINDKRITNSRKKQLIELFVNWANSSDNIGFERLRRVLETGYIKSIENDLYDLLTKRVTIIDTCSRIDKKEGNRRLGYDKLRQSFNDFITELDRLYPDSTKDVESSDDNQIGLSKDGTEMVNSDDIRFSTYLVLKNLYDKWFCGKSKETWWLPRSGYTTEKSDFANMHFIDSYYNDIGTKIICNPDHVVSLISQYMPSEENSNVYLSTTYNIQSLYEFMSSICEKCGMALMSLPLMYGLNPNDKNLMEDMFDAVPFSRIKHSLNDGQTYMCVYSYKPSEHLDLGSFNGDYEYVNDSFDIADVTGKKSNILPVTLEDVSSGSGYRIPSFGVTYAKQNQSYFKNIGVNMENPQVTEASIAMTQLIASKGGSEPRESAIYGQDLYRVYSNYSYTCNVDMMGNSQIMPLMYFQLNNIPLFRGAYMITKVTHNIAAGNMTTQFTGVRQNKNATPLAVGTFVLFDQDGNPVDMGSGYSYGTPLNLFNPVIPDGIYDCDVAIQAMYEPHSYNEVINMKGGNNTTSKHYCAEWVKFYAKSAGAKYFNNKSVGNAWKMRVDGHLENSGFECIDAWLSSDLKAAGCDTTEKARQMLSEWSINGRPGGKKPERGDIMVMQHGNDGHVCMWNDKTNKWVSDFTQQGGPWCYTGNKDYPTQLFLYRWKGTRKINGYKRDMNGNITSFVSNNSWNNIINTV